MVERSLSMREVLGSIPSFSITTTVGIVVVCVTHDRDPSAPRSPKLRTSWASHSF